MKNFEKAIAEIYHRAAYPMKTVLTEETARLAVEALGKQIPQKSYRENIERTIFRYVCPCCSFQLIEGQKFCDGCGQRLEW